LPALPIALALSPEANPQALQTPRASLKPPGNHLSPLLDSSDLATEHTNLCSDGIPEDSENAIDSDPDPGCLDSNPSDQDNNASATQPEDPLMLPGLQSLFENTKLEDLLVTVKFIQALQLVSHDNIYCQMEQSTIKWLRNLSTMPFNITSFPDLCLGIDLFFANMNSSINSFNANRNAIL
jgi:hypothetical protein